MLSSAVVRAVEGKSVGVARAPAVVFVFRVLRIDGPAERMRPLELVRRR